jgi:hypothetical protein
LAVVIRLSRRKSPHGLQELSFFLTRWRGLAHWLLECRPRVVLGGGRRWRGDEHIAGDALMLRLLRKEANTSGVNQQFEVPQKVNPQDGKFNVGT